MEASLIVSLVALAGVLGQAIKTLVERHRGAGDRELQETLRRDIALLTDRMAKIETRFEVHLNGRHTGAG